MKQLTVKIVGSTQGIVTDENGKTYEVDISFHSRTVNGEYKYHEVYVYLNKVNEFKDEFKAPKTLKQKWYRTDVPGRYKGPKLLNYTEVIGAMNTRCQYDINELEFVD